MNKKTFYIVLFSVLALGVVVTAAHFVWDFFAYQHSSIIYFISKELW